jgi:uncharacterized protein YjiS (DUF1127 family)
MRDPIHEMRQRLAPGAAARTCEGPCGPYRAETDVAGGLFGALASLLFAWWRRWGDRCEMRWLAENYPDSLLDDVGLSREELWREAQKPFWMA